MNLQTEIIIHAPEKFAKILKIDGLTPKDIIDSLQVEKNHKQLLKSGEGSG